MEWKEYWETLPDDFKEFAKDSVRMKRCMLGLEEIPSEYADIFNGKAHPDYKWQWHRFFEMAKSPIEDDPFAKYRAAAAARPLHPKPERPRGPRMRP